MNYDIWKSLTQTQREQQMDRSELNVSLLPYKGMRVEATDSYGERVRFWVGQSTGWRPCTLTLHNTRSRGGAPAYGLYTDIKIIRRMK
jgi:hypothetical protein